MLQTPEVRTVTKRNKDRHPKNSWSLQWLEAEWSLGLGTCGLARSPGGVGIGAVNSRRD